MPLPERLTDVTSAEETSKKGRKKRPEMLTNAKTRFILTPALGVDARFQAISRVKTPGENSIEHEDGVIRRLESRWCTGPGRREAVTSLQNPSSRRTRSGVV